MPVLIIGDFLKKSVFCPLETSYNCKKFHLTKMVQNGLKCILNTTFWNVKFCRPSLTLPLIKDYIVSIGNGWTRLLYPVLGDILLELLAKIFNLNWWGGCWQWDIKSKSEIFVGSMYFWTSTAKDLVSCSAKIWFWCLQAVDELQNLCKLLCNQHANFVQSLCQLCAKCVPT